MTTLYSLAKRLEIGDRILLKAVGSEVMEQTPKVVTMVREDEDGIRIEAVGPQEGRYALEVDEDGNQEVFRLTNEHEESRGPAGTFGVVWKYEE